MKRWFLDEEQLHSGDGIEAYCAMYCKEILKRDDQALFSEWCIPLTHKECKMLIEYCCTSKETKARTWTTYNSPENIKSCKYRIRSGYGEIEIWIYDKE